MELINEILGQGNSLSSLQMSARAVIIFIVALVLIRISGRRSFGMRMPFDNVIAILLGAILSRTVTGAAPLLPVIAAATTLVLLHRLFAWIGLYNYNFGRIVKGDARIIYKDGELQKRNMRRALVTDEDLIEGIRINSNLASFEKIKEVYVERDGQISVVKKESAT